MQALKHSFAAAAILISTLPGIGIADDRGISTNEPLACNRLCLWWMAQGKQPPTVLMQPVVANIDDHAVSTKNTSPTRRVSSVRQSRTPPEHIVERVSKQAGSRLLSAQISASEKIIRSIPTSISLYHAPAISASILSGSASNVTPLISQWPEIKTSAGLSTALLKFSNAFPSPNQFSPNGEPDHRPRQDVSGKPIEPISLAAPTTIDRPMRTVAGRVEGAAVVACMLAMIASLKRTSPSRSPSFRRWNAPRPA